VSLPAKRYVHTVLVDRTSELEEAKSSQPITMHAWFEMVSAHTLKL
jgi:hypothetical protein